MMSCHRIMMSCFAATCLAACHCQNDSQHQPANQPGSDQRVESQPTTTVGVSVNATGVNSRTALCHEILALNKESYRQLLSRGADPNVCDSIGMSAMHLAAKQKDIFWLHEALQHQGNPNQPNTGNTFFPNESPIFYAIREQRDQNVLELLAAGANINHMDGTFRTPLYECMEQRMFALMIKLIKAGATPSPPKPARSIFANGWFEERYENLLDLPFSNLPPGGTRADYFALKKLLIENGHLKQE